MKHILISEYVPLLLSALNLNELSQSRTSCFFTSNAFTTVRWSLLVSFANSFLLASAIFSLPFRKEGEKNEDNLNCPDNKHRKAF